MVRARRLELLRNPLALQSGHPVAVLGLLCASGMGVAHDRGFQESLVVVLGLEIVKIFLEELVVILVVLAVLLV